MEKKLVQQTFGVPEQEVKKAKKKRMGIIAGPSYWVCKRGHVFEQKRSIFSNQIEMLKCPICCAKVQNKSSKSTYEYFLRKQGRMDEKEYRAKKVAAEKKRLERAHG